MTDPVPVRKRRLTRDLVTTILDAAGAALVCIGVGFIYWPAAIILAGLAVLAVSYVADRR